MRRRSADGPGDRHHLLITRPPSGGKNSIGCTLILTEGDSAKTLAVSGLGVVGRDRYGVFPLRGKMLNVREASHKQVSVCTHARTHSPHWSSDGSHVL